MSDMEKKTDATLEKELSGHRIKLRELRFARAGSNMRNVREMRSVRKQIARILTEMRARTQKTA